MTSTNTPEGNARKTELHRPRQGAKATITETEEEELGRAGHSQAHSPPSTSSNLSFTSFQYLEPPTEYKIQMPLLR